MEKCTLGNIIIKLVMCRKTNNDIILHKDNNVGVEYRSVKITFSNKYKSQMTFSFIIS